MPTLFFPEGFVVGATIEEITVRLATRDPLAGQLNMLRNRYERFKVNGQGGLWVVADRDAMANRDGALVETFTLLRESP